MTKHPDLIRADELMTALNARMAAGEKVPYAEIMRIAREASALRRPHFENVPAAR